MSPQAAGMHGCHAASESDAQCHSWSATLTRCAGTAASSDGEDTEATRENNPLAMVASAGQPDLGLTSELEQHAAVLRPRLPC